MSQISALNMFDKIGKIIYNTRRRNIETDKEFYILMMD